MLNSSASLHWKAARRTPVLFSRRCSQSPPSAWCTFQQRPQLQIQLVSAELMSSSCTPRHFLQVLKRKVLLAVVPQRTGEWDVCRCMVVVLLLLRHVVVLGQRRGAITTSCLRFDQGRIHLTLDAPSKPSYAHWTSEGLSSKPFESPRNWVRSTLRGLSKTAQQHVAGCLGERVAITSPSSLR